jgi:hypothetical protein
MSRSIFISYRRNDSAPWAGRLYERLIGTFGDERVFLDVDQIAPGEDFAEVLKRRVSQSDALLAVIGPTWVDARDLQGGRRLDDPLDFVRVEIERAFSENVPVVVLLVQGAAMPVAANMPASLAPLAALPPVEITHANFDEAMLRLISAIRALPRRTRWCIPGHGTEFEQIGRALASILVLTIAVPPIAYAGGFAIASVLQILEPDWPRRIFWPAVAFGTIVFVLLPTLVRRERSMIVAAAWSIVPAIFAVFLTPSASEALGRPRGPAIYNYPVEGAAAWSAVLLLSFAYYGSIFVARDRRIRRSSH